jgi:hypothetical protein
MEPAANATGNTSQVIDGIGLQLVKVSDGYGSPILFASLFVYILMRLLVKPFLVPYLAERGLSKRRRQPWILRSTLLPGLVAACLVDFSPISQALGVPLHWIAVIPVGAVFYSAGGVAIHELLKRIDPIGVIAEKFGRKTDRDLQAEAEEIFSATTRRPSVTIEQVEEDRRERDQ